MSKIRTPANDRPPNPYSRSAGDEHRSPRITDFQQDTTFNVTNTQTNPVYRKSNS